MVLGLGSKTFTVVFQDDSVIQHESCRCMKYALSGIWWLFVTDDPYVDSLVVIMDLFEFALSFTIIFLNSYLKKIFIISRKLRYPLQNWVVWIECNYFILINN